MEARPGFRQYVDNFLAGKKEWSLWVLRQARHELLRDELDDRRLVGNDRLRFGPERVNEFETVGGGILCSVRAGKLEFGELAAR